LALQEGEALLQGPCLSHCHLWFYRDAIEACAAAADWERGSRYAQALETFVRAQPLPWALLLVERYRALRDAANSQTHDAGVPQLAAVRTMAVSAGLGWALPAIDQALAKAAG